MSGRISISFVDFAAFSLDSGRVRCAFVEIVSGTKRVRLNDNASKSQPGKATVESLPSDEKPKSFTRAETFF
jgi:hypothetical protein